MQYKMESLKFFKHLFLSLIIGFTALASYISIHLGVFKPVYIEPIDLPSFTLVFVENFGPYHKLGPKFSEVETKMKNLGFNCKKTFGRYLNDPNQMEENRLKAQVGCLFETDNLTPENRALFQAENLQVETTPAQKYVKANFAGSPSISPYKIYPKVEDYFSKLNLPKPIGIEVYEVLNEKEMKTDYLWSLNAK